MTLFDFLGQFPLAIATSLLAIFLVWIFFVAGADAGTIVLGSMSTNGALNPRRTVKLTWGVIMAALAAILLVAGSGGIGALQNGTIMAATPFGLLMLAICWSLYKALRGDRREERRELEEIMARTGRAEDRQGTLVRSAATRDDRRGR